MEKKGTTQVIIFVFLLLMGILTVFCAEKFLRGGHDTAADQLQHDLKNR